MIYLWRLLEILNRPSQSIPTQYKGTFAIMDCRSPAFDVEERFIDWKVTQEATYRFKSSSCQDQKKALGYGLASALGVKMSTI